MKKIIAVSIILAASFALIFAQEGVQSDIGGMFDSIMASLTKVNQRLDKLDPATVNSYQVFSDIKTVRITNEDVWKLWGTLQGLQEAGYKIEYQKAVMTPGPTPEPKRPRKTE